MLRLVSYNIKVGAESSLQEVAQALAALQPDVIALQEVGQHWLWGDRRDALEIIGEACGLAHRRFAPALAWFTGAAFGVAILSRYPIESSCVVNLERHVDEPRVLLEATIKVDIGTHIRVYTTHLSYKEDRVSQAKQIAARLSESGPPAVLLADLNAEPEEGLHVVVAPGFQDAYALCNPDTAGHSFSVAEPKWRIDYALVDPRLSVQHCALGSARASDHFPLLVEVALPTPSEEKHRL